MFYRVPTGTFVHNQFTQNTWTCYCVETLPDIGEPAFSGDLSDSSSIVVIAYYNVTDETVSAYVTDELALMFGVPAGWYPVAVLMSATGSNFAGVITNIAEDPVDGAFRLFLEYVTYSYKDGWTSMKTIGWLGTGPSAEVFNHLSNIASGEASHAEGDHTTASGDNSHAEGYETTASGPFSHAECDYTTASGYASHAEGYESEASGYASHAEG